MNHTQEIFVHYCSKCDHFKYEVRKLVERSWCTRCEGLTDNHLADGKNFKSLAQFERWKKLRSVLGD